MKKRILMIIPSLVKGGAERDFCKVANHLAANHIVKVICFEQPDSMPYPLEANIEFLNIKASKNLLGKMLSFFQRMKKVGRIKKAFKAQITISYLEGANYLNLLTGSNDKKVISSRGSILFDSTITGILGLLRKKVLIPLLYNRADTIVALNNGIGEELKSKLRVKRPLYEVIENSYDPEDLGSKADEPLANQYAEFFSHPVIICVGRLAPEKGFVHLIDLLQKLVAQKPDVRLAFVGEGPERTTLQKQCKKFGLEYSDQLDPRERIGSSRILFLGNQSNPFKYIGKSYLLAIASYAEGGPNVLVESMLCNTIVFSVDCPDGPRERIAPDTKRLARGTSNAEWFENGVLLPMFNDPESYEGAVQEWVKSIAKILDAKEFKMKIEKTAYIYAKQRFSISNVMKSWNSLISKY